MLSTPLTLKALNLIEIDVKSVGKKQLLNVKIVMTLYRGIYIIRIQ